MENKTFLDRLSTNPRVLSGKPVIKGTRLAVDYILKLLGSGYRYEDIKREYEGITDDDIQACILYASEIMRNTEFYPFKQAV